MLQFMPATKISMIPIRSIWILILTSALFSCTNRGSQTVSTATNSMVGQVDQYQLGMDTTWQKMTNSDVNKFDNMTRLIQELKLIDGSDGRMLDSISSQIENVEQVRYNTQNISEPQRIDRFDSVSNLIWAGLRKEVLKTKNAERYQIVNQLVSEIQQADDSVLFYRKNYDRKVDEFNAFYKKNKKELKRAYPNFEQLKPYPVFRLVQ